MKTIYLLILTISISFSVTSQSNKVGVNTTTPTENVDINGLVRLRAHPEDGETNAIYTKTNGDASGTKDQTFTAVRHLMADANGVVGQADNDRNVIASVTKTFIAPSGGFDTGTYDNPPYTVEFGPFTIGFYQKSNNNKLYCVMKSNSTTQASVDLREFTGTTPYLFPSNLINLTAGTWFDLDLSYDGDNYYFVMSVDAWYADIRLANTGKVYLLTVLGARWVGSGGQDTQTVADDQFTVNIMQLSL